MNTAEFLQISSAVVPDRDALVCGDQRVTYMEMAQRVNRLANALIGRGVRRGARVAVMAMNSPQYIEVYYACAKTGAVFVPLNYRAKHEEIVHMLNNSEASLLFVGERYLELANSLRPEVPGVKDLICIDGHPTGLASYDDLLAEGSDDEVYVEIDEERYDRPDVHQRHHRSA